MLLTVLTSVALSPSLCQEINVQHRNPPPPFLSLFAILHRAIVIQWLARSPARPLARSLPFPSMVVIRQKWPRTGGSGGDGRDWAAARPGGIDPKSESVCAAAGFLFVRPIDRDRLGLFESTSAERRFVSNFGRGIS